MTKFSRRQFGVAALAGSAVAATGTASAVPSAGPAPTGFEPNIRSFPKTFRWGAATAAYQIEGAPKADGKGESIWDVFAHTPGKIKDGSTGDVACDSYNRFREDRQLLQDMGANAYRMSVSWPRIFPSGKGRPNSKGLDHYKKVIDDLLEHGIEPFVTLYHWDLPSALPGGWQNRDTALRFADYAGYMASQLSDRVRNFITTNEIGTFLSSGYMFGAHAPGLSLPMPELNAVRHHALLAHGLGVQAIRAHSGAGVNVGLAENPRIPVPVIESAEHIAAARKALRALNASLFAPIMDGRYEPAVLAIPGVAEPIRDGDMAAIGSSLDFVGLNIYSGVAVRADEGPAGFATVEQPKSYPKMTLDWLGFQPEALYWGMRLVSEMWKPKAIYVTENGCPSTDVPVDGRIEDSDRTMFYRQYLTQLQRAVAEGFSVAGYFAWTLLDNFEWAEGYTARFGLHYTDFETQRRIPKLSAALFKEMISRGALA